MAMTRSLKRLCLEDRLGTTVEAELKKCQGFVVMPNCPRDSAQGKDGCFKEDIQSVADFEEWWQKNVHRTGVGKFSEDMYELMALRFVGARVITESCLLKDVIDKTHKRIVILWTMDQLSIMTQSVPKQYIMGPAGSGKTLLLLKKAKEVAGNLKANERILIMCFNKPLELYLDAEFQDFQQLQSNSYMRKRYQHVFVDEGQDMYGMWVDLVKLLHDDVVGSNEERRYSDVLKKAAELVIQEIADLDKDAILSQNEPAITVAEDAILSQNKPAITVDSIRRFKGLEKKVVILFDPPIDEESNIMMDLNYVAMQCYSNSPSPVQPTQEVTVAVPTFCYLGDMIGQSGGCTDAVTARIKLAWKSFHELLPILADRSIPFINRGHVFNSCVRSVMLYGSETWAVSTEDLRRLDRCDNAMIRWICSSRLADRVSSDQLRCRLGVSSLREILRYNRLRWYGHVQRMDPQNWPRKVMTMPVEGRNPRGRPKKRWIDSIREDVKNLKLQKATR
ncbi:hypothetical protein Bbelb_131540 [Branchiostoma belcheri]|nr:hypothetical protein Bbelb_131540 [Branchiostoma belcheri]